MNDAMTSAPHMADAHPFPSRKRHWLRATGLCSLMVILTACGGSSDADGNGDDDLGGEDIGDGGFTFERCNATPVTCVDAHISNLDLLTTPNTGTVSDVTLPSGVFESTLDARAGGLSPTESFFYARFTPTGLEKVELDDQAALNSTDWDIALRRYTVRVNGGVSGPSCVKVARTAPGTDVEVLASVPDGLEFRSESYLTDTCELVTDTTGLGSPATALSSYWTYQSCVQMTDNVYVIRLADARHVKLGVISYYAPDKQDGCDATGTVAQPSEAAIFRIRWAFLP